VTLAVPARPRRGSPPTRPPGPGAASPRLVSRPRAAPASPAQPWLPSARWRARPRSPPRSLPGTSAAPSSRRLGPGVTPRLRRGLPHPGRAPARRDSPTQPCFPPRLASLWPGPATAQRDPGVAPAQHGPSPAWLRLARPWCPCVAWPPARGSALACAWCFGAARHALGATCSVLPRS
jgi:hypothetical protein